MKSRTKVCPSGKWPLKSACPMKKSASLELSDTTFVMPCFLSWVEVYCTLRLLWFPGWQWSSESLYWLTCISTTCVGVIFRVCRALCNIEFSQPQTEAWLLCQHNQVVPRCCLLFVVSPSFRYIVYFYKCVVKWMDPYLWWRNYSTNIKQRWRHASIVKRIFKYVTVWLVFYSKCCQLLYVTRHVM